MCSKRNSILNLTEVSDSISHRIGQGDSEMKKADALTGELRNIWNRKLYLWWRSYNEEYLVGALKLPLIRVGDGKHQLGVIGICFFRAIVLWGRKEVKEWFVRGGVRCWWV